MGCLSGHVSILWLSAVGVGAISKKLCSDFSEKALVHFCLLWVFCSL